MYMLTVWIVVMGAVLLEMKTGQRGRLKASHEFNINKVFKCTELL